MHQKKVCNYSALQRQVCAYSRYKLSVSAMLACRIGTAKFQCCIIFLVGPCLLSKSNAFHKYYIHTKTVLTFQQPRMLVLPRRMAAFRVILNGCEHCFAHSNLFVTFSCFGLWRQQMLSADLNFGCYFCFCLVRINEKAILYLGSCLRDRNLGWSK